MPISAHEFTRMQIDNFTLIALLTALVLAGFIGSIAGGGGLITLPTLLLAGLPPQLALGTNKFASTLGTLVAALNFARKKLVWWPMIAFGCVFVFDAKRAHSSNRHCLFITDRRNSLILEKKHFRPRFKSIFSPHDG